MGCLDNIVGVKGCGTTPTGVYVQQLPGGISIADFDLAISNEHKAALPALQSIVNFATNDTLNRIREYLQTKHKLKSFIENDTVGFYEDNKEAIDAQTGYLTGYQIKIDRTPYLSFHISQLRLFVNNTGNVDVLIYDLTEGRLLQTVTVSAVAGQIVTADVDLTVATHKQRLNLFIGYASSFESYKTSTFINSGYEISCTSSFQGGAVLFKTAKILSGSTKINENVESNSYGAGISIDYSVQCSYDEFLCNIKNQLAYPILYRAGELIMIDMINSKRLTGVVRNFQDEHKSLMDYYADEHRKRMEHIMHNMVLPSDSVCFACAPKVKTVVNFP